MKKELLKTFYFLETIDKMYFFTDDAFGLNLHIDDKNPKNPRIVELFYFPYQKFHFENLYFAKRHYSSFEMEHNGKIYKMIDKYERGPASPGLKKRFAQKIISFVDKDLAKARKTVYRSIGTLINIYTQTIKGLENMIEAIEEGRDLHILEQLWFFGYPTNTDFDPKEFKGHLKYLINQIFPVLRKLKKLTFKIQEITEYTILSEYTIWYDDQKLYEIEVRFVADNKNGYAYYNILIDYEKIRVSIEVEYDIEVVKDIYENYGLVVRPFSWWSSEAEYRDTSWYYLLRPEP